MQERAHTRAAEITQEAGSEVDALHQGAAVDPLSTRVPPFHARRIQELLPHVGRLLGELANPWRGELEPSSQPQEIDDHLSGAFDFGKAGVLKEVGIEQHPESRAHIALRFPESSGDGLNGLEIPRWRGHPCRHLWLIGNEEVVEMTGDKSVTGGLLHDDVDDVLPVQIARMAQERLFAIIMIVLEVLE